MVVVQQTDSLAQANVIGDTRFGMVSFVGSLGQRFVVTAVVASGNLRLIAWRVEDDWSISRLGAESAGPVDLVGITRVSFGFLVTAVRLSATKRLRLIWWRFDQANGTLHRMLDTGDTEDAGIGDLSVTSNGDALVAVASGGQLFVKRWTCDQFGQITKLADSHMQGPDGGAASEVVIGAYEGGRIYTVTRSPTNALQLIRWSFSASGAFTRVVDSGTQGGSCLRVPDLAYIPEDDHRLVTAGPDGNNNLKVIAWNDGTLKRLFDSGGQAGGVGQVACSFDQTVVVDGAEFGPLDAQVVTAVTTKRSVVKIIVWRIGTKGMTRTEEFGEHTGVTTRLSRLVRLAEGAHLLAARDAEGRLRLRIYRIGHLRQPTALPDTITVSTTDSRENTVMVVPPPSGFLTGNGTIVISLGDGPVNAKGGGGGYSWRDLFSGPALNRTIPISSPSTFVPYPLGAEHNAWNDNQIIRLQDGSLLASKHGQTWENLPAPAGSPDWFSANLSIGTSENGPFDKRTRAVIHIFRSEDEARSWTRVGGIDPLIVAGGVYAPPQRVPDGAGGFTYWYGGWDRSDLYQDPWTGRVFVATDARGGLWKKKTDPAVIGNPNVECFGEWCHLLDSRGIGLETTKDLLVLASDHPYKTWSVFATIKAGADKPGSPYSMTSTQDSPLLLFGERGSEVVLFHAKHGQDGLFGGETITLGADAAAHNWDVSDIAWGQNSGPVCIVRLGSTRELLYAYPTLEADGRQVFQIGRIEWSPFKASQPVRVAVIEAADLTQSVLMGTFAADEFDSDGDGSIMFSWYEAPPTGGTVRARCRVFFGQGGQHPAEWLTRKAGAPGSFMRTSIGHYTKSAGFHLGPFPAFIALWRGASDIQGNIVQMITRP